MIKKLAIIIPTHKRTLNNLENISFNRVIEKYKSQQWCEIFLVIPKKNKNQLEFNYENIAEYTFDDSYFESINGYNLLKTNLIFYNKFKNFHFLLTYELDSIIIGDLFDFLEKYRDDYCGAPWIENGIISGVGNSGFSIRNGKKCRVILWRLEILRLIFRLLTVVPFLRLEKRFLIKKNYLGGFFKIKDTSSLALLIKSSKLKQDYVPDDVFWSIKVAKTFVDFKVSTIDTAIKFAWDDEKMFLLKNYSLPVGIHKFQTADLLCFINGE